MLFKESCYQSEDDYLFAAVAKRAAAFAAEHPEQKLLDLSIGDVSLPLSDCVTNALITAAREMGKADTFRGYGPAEGDAFLREAIKNYYLFRHGVSLEDDEIFVSDGAKSDLGDLPELFSEKARVLLPDPCYPAVLRAVRESGRPYSFFSAGEKYLPPPDPGVNADLIFLCSPANPTGGVFEKDTLAAWVDYANRRGAVIFYDAAYEAFIRESGIPGSVYEIAGAKNCAIEIGSLSKSAGFTGLRCGYSILPRELKREGISLASLWKKRLAIRRNGVSYPVERAAEATLGREGRIFIRTATDEYLSHAARLAGVFRRAGYDVIGGENSPYLWVTASDGRNGEAFFDLLLTKIGVTVTPGIGFGKSGENKIRLSALASRAVCLEAAERFEGLFRAEKRH